jgi:hypothetical protein
MWREWDMRSGRINNQLVVGNDFPDARMHRLRHAVGILRLDDTEGVSAAYNLDAPYATAATGTTSDRRVFRKYVEAAQTV